jgi:hypothetical protein
VCCGLLALIVIKLFGYVDVMPAMQGQSKQFVAASSGMVLPATAAPPN